MANIRILKRKDGVIVTQHRGDERYDDATLPAGTRPEDVLAELVVPAADLEGVTDVQAQIDVVDGKLVKDTERKPAHERLAERRAAALATLRELDADAAVPAATKRYLVALREALAPADAPRTPERR
jgi:hypothetical protein